MMTHEQFIDRVQWVGRFDSKRQAEKAVRAVLGVLQENISGKALKEMLSLLPEDYAAFFSRARELALSKRTGTGI